MTSIQFPISSRSVSVCHPSTDEPIGGLRQRFISLLQWRPHLSTTRPSEQAIAALRPGDRITERY